MCPMSPAVPARPMEAAAGDDAGADPGPDLDEDHLVQTDRDPGPPLPEGHTFTSLSTLTGAQPAANRSRTG